MTPPCPDGERKREPTARMGEAAASGDWHAWSPPNVGDPARFLLAALSGTATPFAFVHLVGEAVYVGGLALLEWRHRKVLRTAA